ncbi:hypothetical protein LUZ60_007808 [Juncus effusus]|nr:hypothetical protein LUZ60_007808 [Juncus effusus]
MEILAKGIIEKNITENEEAKVHESEELRGKGGLRSLPFIMGNEIFERVAGAGLSANMIRYLTESYHMSPTNSSIIMNVSSGVSNILPIFGAYLSDAYFGRFLVLTFCSIIFLIGNTLLWLTTLMTQSGTSNSCIPKSGNCNSGSATVPRLALLGFALAFMSVGSGGLKPCNMAFGADQLSNCKNKSTLQKYFNIYYSIVGLSFIFAIGVIVPIQDKFGWRVGYLIPVVLMAISIVLFLSGSSLYIKKKGNKSLLNELWPVIKKAFENRHVKLPPKVDDGLYFGYEIQVPSEKLSFFNKACIISNTKEPKVPSQYLCAVEQVENLKTVIRILPIWSASIIMSLFMSQNFATLQALKMDRHVFPWFQIPPASFGIFSVITMTIWSGGYNRFILPLIKKITNNTIGLSQKQRIGIGIIIGILAMAVSAIVENYRRRFIISSARWLIPQFALLGLAEAFAIIGQIEFYYNELPKSMKSFGVALFSLGMGIANMVMSGILKTIKNLSRVGGRRGWLTDELNDGRYDYYYWVLAGLGVLGFGWFVVCSRVYGEEGKNKYWDDDEEGDSQVIH